jgi:hypothetical protein
MKPGAAHVVVVPLARQLSPPEVRTSRNPLTTPGVELRTTQLLMPTIPCLLPRFPLRVGAVNLCAQLDALQFTNNAFAVFPKTPASVEVSVALLFARFAELCAMRKLTIFYADDEPS